MMKTQTRSREYLTGWLGRKRNYKCRACGEKFQHDGGQLPEKARICLDCRMRPKHFAKFEKAMDER